jgi:glycosyltransferase involved in cell wall biosynthesis
MDLSELTIIVPTRNEAHNIPDFLNSLHPSVSLIVVDASEDDTPDLVTRIRPDNSQVIRDPGKIAEARQIGAKAATTPWLLFTDADVIFAADYFEQLPTYQNFDALYGSKLSRDQYMGYYRWFTRGQQLIHNLGIPAVSGSNLIVGREAFWNIGGFDLNLTVNEDSEIGWRIKRNGYRIVFAPDLIVYARDHRRLEWGTTRKTVHSLTRCIALYFNIIPEKWRRHDWGYWPGSKNTGSEENKPGQE